MYIYIYTHIYIYIYIYIDDRCAEADVEKHHLAHDIKDCYH